MTIIVKSDTTIIRADEHLTNLVGGLYGGIMGGVGGSGFGLGMALGLAALHSGATAFGLTVASIVGSYGLARSIYTGVADSRERELRRLVQSVADHLGG